MDPFRLQRLTSTYHQTSTVKIEEGKENINNNLIQYHQEGKDFRANRLNGGVESGWVKCSLCAIKSKKRFAAGRGLTMHLQTVHKNLTENELCLAIADSMKTLTQNKGLTRDGKPATKYKDALPLACQYAKSGDVNALKKLGEENFLCYYDKDKYGANCLDWACGEGNLSSVQFLVARLFAARTFNDLESGISTKEGVKSPFFSLNSINQETIEGILLTKKLSWEEVVELSEIPGYLQKDDENAKQGISKALKRKGNIGRRDGKTCYHWTCRNGKINVLKYLLLITKPDSSYDLLIEKKRTVSTGDDTKMLTGKVDSAKLKEEPLNAIKVDDDAAIRHNPYSLLAFNIRSGDGTTPLHVACYGGSIPMLDHLNSHLSQNAFLQLNDWNCTNEHFLCMGLGEVDVLEFYHQNIHKSSADGWRFFTMKNKEGMTPVLKWILKKKNVDGLKWFKTLFDKLLSEEISLEENLFLEGISNPMEGYCVKIYEGESMTEINDLKNENYGEVYQKHETKSQETVSATTHNANNFLPEKVSTEVVTGCNNREKQKNSDAFCDTRTIIKILRGSELASAMGNETTADMLREWNW